VWAGRDQRWEQLNSVDKIELRGAAGGVELNAGGKRPQGCSTAAFATQAVAQLAGPLSELLTPVLEAISTVTAQIKALDRQVKSVCTAHQEEVTRLTQVPAANRAAI
jgi:hypothetical protein